MKQDRRNAIKNLALAGSVLGLSEVSCSNNANAAQSKPQKLKGNIHHSVCRWCYNDVTLDNLAKFCSETGIEAIDLLKPDEWDTAAKYGVKCSMATDTFANIVNGFNDPANHADLQSKYSGLIKKASDKGIKQVIVFSGNKRNLSSEQGIENCAIGLAPLVKQAEAQNVTLVMELLNSKVNHKDYQCDHTEWGVALCKKIGSENFKLLYDIYHMQIMEGDIIANIKEFYPYFAHYHTGGVPGRNEINSSQELNYPAIMKAIVNTGFNGYVAQEFIPTYTDKLSALKEGVLICDV